MATITKETVEAVIKYNRKYPQMTMKELGALCGIAGSSVSNILNGMYNELLENNKDENKKSIDSQIPYDEYKRLVTCELAIKEMLERTKKSQYEAKELFLDFRSFSEIIQKCFPEEYAKKIKELYGSDEDFDFFEEASL